MAEISRRKRIWGWNFFDWASQPYHTLLVTFVFGPYFAGVAAEYFMASGLAEPTADARAQAVWSLCLAVSGLVIGFGAPLIGAMALPGNRVEAYRAGMTARTLMGFWMFSRRLKPNRKTGRARCPPYRWTVDPTDRQTGRGSVDPQPPSKRGAASKISGGRSLRATPDGPSMDEHTNRSTGPEQGRFSATC